MIIVTGGTGLVGSHLLLKLIENGEKVRALIRPTSSPNKVLKVWKHYKTSPEELLSKIDWYTVDFDDNVALHEAFEGCRHVYHCAARVSFDSRYANELWNSNVNLTEAIVNICLSKNIEKLVYLSTIAAIGPGVLGSITTEKDAWPIHPKSLYSKTKTRAEFEVWRGITEGLNAVIVNPSVILGPGDWGQSSSRLFDVLYRGLKYYTSGSTGFVGIDDVIEIMLILMKSDITGERYILNAKNMSYYDFFKSLATALGMKAPSKKLSPFLSSIAWRIEWIISRISNKEARITRQSSKSANQIQEYCADKISKDIGYNFTDLEYIIKKTAKYYHIDKESI